MTRVGLILALIMVVTLSLVDADTPTFAQPYSSITNESVIYEQRITKWNLPFLKDDGVSGPFTLLSETKFLFVSRCGAVSIVNKSGDRLALERQGDLLTPSDAPLDCAFASLLGGVKGLLVDQRRGTAYVSYNVKPNAGCLKLAIVKYHFANNWLSRPKTVFISQPCYPEQIAVLTESGGALAEDSRGNIFFSVSDFGSLGDSQRKTTSYGKIFEYNPTSNDVSMYALGIRNAEGLFWSGDVLYEDEHGPKGGDELNIVNKGDNLGWDRSSYGIPYQHNTYDNYDGPWASHNFGKKPAFAWLPSIGPAGIIVYPGHSYFKNWRGNVLLVSLRARTLFRVDVEDGRGIFAEPVATIGDRMRFIAVSPSGVLWIKADPQTFIEVARVTTGGKPSGLPVPYTNEQVSAGEVLYNAHCAICHGATLQGTGNAKPLAGATMTHLNVASLHEKVQEMPANAPHSLSPTDYAALTAYILKYDCVPQADRGRQPFPVSDRSRFISIKLNGTICR